MKTEFHDSDGYSPRNLARMRKFYTTYKDLSILPTPLAKLPWSFNCLLIDKVDDIDKRVWYAEKCIENGWSHVVLDHQIDLNLYERQADSAKELTNFNDRLPAAKRIIERYNQRSVYFRTCRIKGKNCRERYRKCNARAD